MVQSTEPDQLPRPVVSGKEEEMIDDRGRRLGCGNLHEIQVIV